MVGMGNTTNLRIPSIQKHGRKKRVEYMGKNKTTIQKRIKQQKKIDKKKIDEDLIKIIALTLSIIIVFKIQQLIEIILYLTIILMTYLIIMKAMRQKNDTKQWKRTTNETRTHKRTTRTTSNNMGTNSNNNNNTNIPNNNMGTSNISNTTIPIRKKNRKKNQRKNKKRRTKWKANATNYVKNAENSTH